MGGGGLRVYKQRKHLRFCCQAPLPLYVSVPAKIDHRRADAPDDRPFDHHRVAPFHVAHNRPRPRDDDVGALDGSQHSLEAPLHSQQALELQSALCVEVLGVSGGWFGSRWSARCGAVR